MINKVICLCLLWKTFDWSERCCTFVVKFSFFVLNNLSMNTFMFYYRKPWQLMCFLPLLNVQIWRQHFDLWMLRLSYDIYALVINSINPSWVPCHINVRSFETLDICSVAFVEQLKVFLVEFNLTNKYVKDEGANLNFLTTTFTSIVSCELLHLFRPFVSFCFGHVMPKAC